MKTKKTSIKDRRRGTVLVLVVAILAVLMGLAATLALVTRMEMRMSENYLYNQTVAQVADALEIYSTDYLARERYFGSDDGGLRFYDPKQIHWIAGDDASGLSKADLLGDIDKADTRWMETETIAALPDAFAIIRRDEGVDLHARFITHFEDLGGSRLDVNMTGNRDNDEHEEGAGENPFRTRLEPVQNDNDIFDTIIMERDYADTEFYGYNPDYPDSENPFAAAELLELLWPDAVVDDNDGPAGRLSGLLYEFEPDDWTDYAPFLTTASATNIFADFVDDAEGVDFEDFDEVVKWLGAEDFDMDSTNSDSFPFYNDDYNHLLLQRPLRQIILTLYGNIDENDLTKEDGVEILRDFLKYVDDKGDGFVITAADSEGTKNAIITQAALNIWNMMAYLEDEEDMFVYNWDDPDDNDKTYYGVVPGTPYVAEIAPVVNSELFAYIPANDGAVEDVSSRLDADGNIAELLHGSLEERDEESELVATTDFWWYAQGEQNVYSDEDYQLDKDGEHDWGQIEGREADESWSVGDNDFTFTLDAVWPVDNPPTGWGKYIKLVNPWDEEIEDLSDYSLEIEYVPEGWEWTDQTWETYTPEVPSSIPLEGNIPPRGHFLIVDSDEDPDGNSILVENISADNYQVEPDLTYMTDDIKSIALYKNNTAIISSTVKETPNHIGQDSDEGNFYPDSFQIRDPRPCWVRDGSGQDEPWSGGAWDTHPKTVENWTGDSYTTNMAWFNVNWCDVTVSSTVESGDNWYKLHADSETTPPDNEHNLLDSFKLPDKLVSPSDITYVHAGADWSTLSPSGGGADPGTEENIGAAEVVFLKGL